jgi:hypothetical protein
VLYVFECSERNRADLCAKGIGGKQHALASDALLQQCGAVQRRLSSIRELTEAAETETRRVGCGRSWLWSGSIRMGHTSSHETFGSLSWRALHIALAPPRLISGSAVHSASDRRFRVVHT